MGNDRLTILSFGATITHTQCAASLPSVALVTDPKLPSGSLKIPPQAMSLSVK